MLQGCSMATALRLCAAAGIGVWLAASAIAADDRKTPDSARPDPRLDQRITISTAYDSLQEFCAKLGALSAATDLARAGAGEADGRPPVRQAQGKQRAPPTGEANPSAPVPVEITCDPAIKEHKVVVRVMDQPLREVMRQIAVLFDFTWMQGPQEHPRYHLMQNSARAKLAAALRRRYDSEREARDRRIFRDALRALKAGPDELYDLAQKDPEAIAFALTGGERVQLLGALNETSLEAVLNGEAVALPVSQLSPELQAYIEREFVDRRKRRNANATGEENLAWDLAELRFTRPGSRHGSPASCMIIPWVGVPYLDPSSGARRPEESQLGSLFPPPWTRYAARLADYENTDAEYLRDRYERVHRLETDYGIKVIDRARAEPQDAIPEWARSKIDHGVVRPGGESRPLKSKHADLLFALPKLLAEVADALNINLIADCYWTHTSREWFMEQGDQGYTLVYPMAQRDDKPCWVDSNPEYTLNRICEQRGRSWVKDGEFFRVRNLLWFVDDPEEVPASVLNEWMRRTKREKRVTVEDYLYLAESLSEKLAYNIHQTSYRGERSGDYIGYPLRDAAAIGRGYYPMKLYSLLSPQIRPRLSEVGIGLADELPQDLMPVMRQALEAEQSVRGATYGWLPQDKIGGLRLWAGNRPGSLAGEVRFHLGFCIELWSGGQPDWNDPKKDDGRIKSWDYPLEPNNIPGVDVHY